MGIWTVLTRERPGDTAADSAARAVFVREKFSWMTLLFAPLVLLRFRLWLALAAYVAVAALLYAAVRYGGVPGAVRSIVMTGFHVLLAFELPSLRLRKLARLGYAEAGVVIGEDRVDAEHRFFANWAAPRPAASLPAIRPAPPGAPSGVIGAFPGT